MDQFIPTFNNLQRLHHHYMCIWDMSDKYNHYMGIWDMSDKYNDGIIIAILSTLYMTSLFLLI